MSALPSAIARVGVIGAGQMGLGIAYVSALHAKAQVFLYDASPAAMDKGVAMFDSLLKKDVGKSKITQKEADEAKARLSVIKGGLSALGDRASSPQMIIEAATENLRVKQDIFKTLADSVPIETILATNTSSISISKIAASAVRNQLAGRDDESAARCLGIHFMNPVPVLPLVEIIPALQTSPEVLALGQAFARACGKTLVTSADTPGFVANRLLMPYINEAVLLLSENVASKEDIDTTMKLGMSHPMGPLTLADFIGLDTCYAIMETLHRETGDSKYRPATLLGRMVDAGWLGKKTGKGFYDYSR